MNTWITSDLHFGHNNILKYCPNTRGHFRDVSHMNEEMIHLWNDSVLPTDTVYLLGDIAFSNSTEAIKILKRLNGRKILIEGNHDRKNLRDPVFRNCFEEIHNYLEITYNKISIIMFHYPIAEFNLQFRGAVHFHGHCHGNPSGIGEYRAVDVGYDATGQVVNRIEDMIQLALKGKIKESHRNM